MELQMQGPNGRPKTLKDHDDYMGTGEMGDCVCLVVMWNFMHTVEDDEELLASRVRGFHFLGGIGTNVGQWDQVLDQLFLDVPNGPGTLVNAVYGHVASASNDPLRVRNLLLRRLPLARRASYASGDALVARSGVVFDYDKYAPEESCLKVCRPASFRCMSSTEWKVTHPRRV